MKKYILIQNDGEIESNSFELIGASTKRDQSGKIGFFGSGLKYSIAYMMRKGIEFKIFSGNKELIFTTTQEVLKGQTFERICINGKETSYTITMGPTWTKDWFVLREVYCNALDESNCIIVKDTEIVQPSEGKTRIFIELTEELKEVSKSWDAYFAEDRTPLFTTEPIYTCYLGTSDTGNRSSSQRVSVYDRTNGTIYRKGIRVYDYKSLAFDYGFDFVDINEDRTSKHPGALSYTIYNLLATFSDESYIKTILRLDESAEYMYLTNCEFHEAVSDKWVEFSKANLLVVKEISGRYASEINGSKKEIFQIPSALARSLKKKRSDINILGMGTMVGNFSFNVVEPNAKTSFLLKQVSESLNDLNYKIPYPVSIADFDDEDVMGFADMEEKKIYIASSTFDKGRREIATTIMEECEHINSKASDETRAFQNHIFSSWLKSLEETNGIFL